MKASDYIVTFLRDRGVDAVFGYSGGAITHLMDSLSRFPGIRFIQAYHEQTAAIAAEGYSCFSSALGVAMATSGPGGTNLITGIADAYFDSIPTLFITGQVNTYEYKGEKPIRQQGFQETDIVSIARPITKYAAMVMDPKNIRRELEKAWSIATTGRFGPVLLDIPMDVQRSDIDETALAGFEAAPSPDQRLEYLCGFSREALASLVADSRRPILLLGNGIKLAGAHAEAGALARSHGLPVVTSLLAKGLYPEDDRLSLGMIGSYGNRCANLALANADLVIALGARLDTRQTGTDLPAFTRGRRVVRLDIDRAEIEHSRLAGVDAVLGGARAFIGELSSMPWGEPRESWLSHIDMLKREYGQDAEVARNVENKRPYATMDILNHHAADNQIIIADSGQDQMFAAQKLRIREGQSWKLSSGLAPMGFALPAAIGAAFATRRERPIYAIVGDGALHISSQSLLLIAQYDLPIKIVLLNNRSLGMIAQFQDLYFGGRKSGTTKESGYLVPDFRLMAESCGLAYARIGGEDYENAKKLASLFRAAGPALIEFDVGEDTVVYPKLEVNMPLENQSPRLGADELARLMLRDRDR
jgi:acetolactate synthase-1/2/3 large subunit